MIPPRWRKVLRELWQFKTRTLLVTLSIAVGVFAFGTIAGARLLLLHDLHSSFLAVHPASATLFSDPFDQDVVDTIARMPAVGAAQGRRLINARAKTGPDSWYDIQLIAVPDDAMTIGIVRPLSGTWPPAKKQLTLEASTLAKLGVEPGALVTVELPNGKTRDIRIGGLSYDFSLPPPPIAAKAFGYVSLDTLEWLYEPREFNQLQIITAEHPEDQAHIWQVTSQVEKKLNDAGIEVQRSEVPTPLEHPAEQILPTILLILGMLGVLALLLSAFLIVNTIGSILAQQQRQIGVMKAIGASTGQIMQLYLGMVLVFGLLALLVAVPLGGLASHAFSQYMAHWLNFTITTPGIPLSVLAIEIAAGLLVPALTSLFPIISTARLTVRDALSGEVAPPARAARTAPSASGVRRLLALPASALRRVFGLLAPLSARLGRPLLLSLRNTFRRRGRLIRTLIPLTLAGAVFVSVLTVRTSLFASLDAALTARRYDIVVGLSQSYRSVRLEQDALQVPSVSAAETWRQVKAQPVRANGDLGDPVTLQALPADTQLLRPDILAGRWLLPNDEAALVVSQNYVNYKEPTTQIGDQITLRINNDDYRFTVVGVNREFVPKVAPAVGYVPAGALARLIGGAGRGDSLHVRATQRDDTSQTQVAQALDARLDRKGFRVNSVKTTREDRDSLIERFNLITAVLSIMAVLIGAVGCLGLMGTMSMNVLERTREIGIMRAIGASNAAVRQIVISEGVLIGLLAWLAGMLLSLVLSRVMCYQLGMNLLTTPLEYHYASGAVLIWLITIVALSALSSFIPAQRAAQLTIREVLAYDG